MKKRIYYLLSALLLLGAISAKAQVAVGTTEDPHAGAVMELQSETKGLLLPRVELQGEKIWSLSGEAADGMTVFNKSGVLPKGVYVWIVDKWVNADSGSFEEEYPLWAELSVGTSRTLKVMTYNLGANPTADPMVYSEEILGDVYQWGRVADGHQSRTSTSITGPATASDLDNGQIASGNALFGKFITNNNTPYDWQNPQNNSLWGDGTQNMNVAKSDNDPCPEGWRIPTWQQWQALMQYNDWTWTENGYKVENGSESLFLPAAGTRRTDATLHAVGTEGYYWCSTVYQTLAYCNQFDERNFTLTHYRAAGASVRCVEE